MFLGFTIGILLVFMLCSANSFAKFPPVVGARVHGSVMACVPPATTLTTDGTIDSFDELFPGKMPSWLIDRCQELGFMSATKVQRLALPDIFDGKDVILQAHTGSGKTLTYALPILSKIDPNRAAIQAVIVVPTRELGLQVAGILRQLASASEDKILVMSVMEGSKNRRQALWAKAEPPHVVVGNPRSLQRLVDNGHLRLQAVNCVVLDEVDACLISIDTRAELHALLSRHLSSSFQMAEDEDQVACRNMEVNRVFVDRCKGRTGGTSYRNSRQTILCSATIPQRQHFATQCFKQGWTETVPVVIHPEGGAGMVPEQVTHEFVECTAESRVALTMYLLETERARCLKGGGEKRGFQAICFTDDESVAARLGARLVKAQSEGKMGGYAVLGSEKGLNARADALDDFRRTAAEAEAARDPISGAAAEAKGWSGGARTEVLVAASSLAARGLDIPGISTVVMLDLPDRSEDYVHRAGRAGRLGREGRVITLVRDGQQFVLDRYSNELGVEIKQRVVKMVSKEEQ
jgi:superfamily II DNA/RNA helicase